MLATAATTTKNNTVYILYYLDWCGVKKETDKDATPNTTYFPYLKANVHRTLIWITQMLMS